MKTATTNDKQLTVNLTLNIPQERIADLLCCAIEGGSTYWCSSCDRQGGISQEQAPYRQDVPFVNGGWLEVCDGENKNKAYRLDLNAIKKGLNVMATKYPKHFADFMAENEDAITGDVFFQCCVFGDAIYG